MSTFRVRWEKADIRFTTQFLSFCNGCRARVERQLLGIAAVPRAACER